MAPPEVVSTRPCPPVPAFKERPILFSAPMVRALLDGSKTQTRRIFKLPPGCAWYGGLGGEKEGWLQDDTGPAWWHVSEQRCPYGQPGDRLWVREAWAPREIDPECTTAAYRATDDECNGPWKPSIHMPRWACRMELEIISVRVERLQDISEADAVAEGIERPEAMSAVSLEAMDVWSEGSERACFNALNQPIAQYRRLWESLNAAGRPALPANPKSKRYARVKAWLDKHPDTTSWAANPWVWCVEFRRILP